MPSPSYSASDAYSGRVGNLWLKLLCLVALLGMGALTAAAFIKSAQLETKLEDHQRPVPPPDLSYTRLGTFLPYPDCNTLLAFGRPHSTQVLVCPTYDATKRADSSEWQLWDVESAARIHDPPVSRKLTLRPFGYSADGKWLCVSTNEDEKPYKLISALDGTVYPVSDYQSSYNFLTRLIGSKREVLIAAFSADSQRLVLVSSANTLSVFDVNSREKLAEKEFPSTQEFVDITEIPGSTAMVCLTIEQELIVFDSRDCTVISQYQAELEDPLHAQLLPTADARRVLINGDFSNSSYVVDIATGAQTLFASVGKNVLCTLPGRNVALVGDLNGTVYFVDYVTHEVINGINAHPNGKFRDGSKPTQVMYAGASSDGSILWTVGLDTQLRFWRLFD